VFEGKDLSPRKQPRDSLAILFFNHFDTASKVPHSDAGVVTENGVAEIDVEEREREEEEERERGGEREREGGKPEPNVSCSKRSNSPDLKNAVPQIPIFLYSYIPIFLYFCSRKIPPEK